MYATVYGGGRSNEETSLDDAAQAQGRAVVELLYGAQLEQLRASLAALAAHNRASAALIEAEAATVAEPANWKEV